MATTGQRKSATLATKKSHSSQVSNTNLTRIRARACRQEMQRHLRMTMFSNLLLK